VRGGDVVTTVLDLLGSLLLIVGAALFVAAYSVPAAFVVAGVLVIALSYAIDRKAARS
jgi:hypothetical protein